MKKYFGSFFIAITFLVSSCNSTPRATPEEIQALEARLKDGEQDQTLVHIYEQRSFQPLWIADGKPTLRIDALTQALAQAPLHGLNPAEYAVTRPEKIDNPIEYELGLTRTLVKFAFDIAGQHDHVERVLSDVIAEDALTTAADRLAPAHVEYRNLQRALQTFQGPSDQVEKIKLNLNRIRRMPVDLGARYIRVNVPEYRMHVIEDGREALSMNVVVGRPQTPTPIFSDAMTHIVFSPYWNIPQSILKNETLPKVFEDENYLIRQNIEVIRVSDGQHQVVDPSEIDWSDPQSRRRFHFRQRPGVRNSLGLVKFMFPNKFDVYLHDTPADNLFKLDERDLSHGCVRLEKPLELAAYLLRDEPQWSEQKIKAAMHSGRERSVKLSEPIPVHIMYLTAWGTPEGGVEFAEDVYNLDMRAAE